MALLDACEDWMYDDAEGCGGDPLAGKATYEAKLADLTVKLEPSCGKYLVKVAEAKLEREKALEVAAAEAAAEAAANGDEKQARRLTKCRTCGF